jgi:hypothetical protein
LPRAPAPRESATRAARPRRAGRVPVERGACPGHRSRSSNRRHSLVQARRTRICSRRVVACASGARAGPSYANDDRSARVVKTRYPETKGMGGCAAQDRVYPAAALFRGVLLGLRWTAISRRALHRRAEPECNRTNLALGSRVPIRFLLGRLGLRAFVLLLDDLAGHRIDADFLDPRLLPDLDVE